MAINLTDALNAATTKGKLADAKQIYLEGDNKNLQDAHKDNEDHLNTLDTRSTQIEESLKTIAATGGASNANAVTYDNTTSGLTSVNAKGAIDELATRFTEIENNVGLYNVDKNIPLGSGYYTSTTAHAAIPIAVRKLGLIITYKTDSTTSVTEQFIGSDVSGWTTNTNWKNIGSEGGNKILEWNTNIATTRKQVPSKERKSLLQISYKNESGEIINEQYVGTSLTDTEWAKDANWEQIPNQKQISALATKEEINMLGYTSFGPDDSMMYAADYVSGINNTSYNLFVLDIPADTHIDAIRFRAAPNNTTIFYKGKLSRTTGTPVVSEITEIARYAGKTGDTIINIPIDLTIEQDDVIGVGGAIGRIENTGVASSFTNNWGTPSNSLYLYSLIQYTEDKVPTANNIIDLEKATAYCKENIAELQDDNNIIKSGGLVKTNYFTVPLQDQRGYYDKTTSNKKPTDGIFHLGNAKIERDGKVSGIYINAGNIFQPCTIYVYKNKTNEIIEIESLYLTRAGRQYIQLSNPYPVEKGDYITASIVTYKIMGVNRGMALTIENGIVTRKQPEDWDIAIQAVYYTEKTVRGLVDISDTDEYIALQDDDMKIANSNWEVKDWSFSENGATPNSTGNTTYLRNKLKYLSDKRYMRMRVNMGTDTILKIPVANSDRKYGLGASCFAVDFLNKKLIIYQVGNGTDTQNNSNGYTNTELVTATIPDDMIAEREYIIELHKDNTLNKLILTDTLTAKQVEVEHDGWGAGRQNMYYAFYVESGTLPTITMFQVFSLNQPDVVFAGDSITEGDSVTDRSKRYAEQYRQNHKNKKVVISALSGDNIDGIIYMFDTEYNIYRPKVLSVLIGANGGNTTSKLQTLKTKCDNIGCKLILNRLTCQQSNDAHIAKNEMIESLGLPGARFDIATAKDNYPYVDELHTSPRYNQSLYADTGLHPNNDGQIEMYKRFYIDVPEL